eukprot:TRINITY_DN11001_c0_g1_i1.p1 TRINITY_DN11001_c0_g1~~TRINITY_DN11001_c0_g1_i1.p1  ORF type:complete len:642 (-),score=166.33 TRINITY_DN11001_c0_g1_i1:553-2478(-)
MKHHIMKTAAFLATLVVALPGRHGGGLKPWQGGPAGAILADDACERQEGCDSSGIGMLQTTMLRMQATAEVIPDVASAVKKIASNSSNSTDSSEHDEITDNAIVSIEDLWTFGVANEENQTDGTNGTNKTFLTNMSNVSLKSVKHIPAKIPSVAKAVLKNKTDKSNDSSADNESQAVVHVTVDFAEKAEVAPDNRSLVAAGVELARSLTDHQVENANKTLNETLVTKADDASFRLRALVWDAANESKGSLDGVIQRIVTVNCSLHYLTAQLLQLTNISIERVLKNTTKRLEDGTCIMAVSNAEANRQTQEELVAEFVAIADRTGKNISAMFEKARKDANDTLFSIVDEAFVGPNCTIYRSVTESRAAAQGSLLQTTDNDEDRLLRDTMYKAVRDVNSSVAESLAELWKNTTDDLDRGVLEILDSANRSMFNVIHVTKEFATAVKNSTRLRPLSDLEVRMSAAQLDLTSAIRLMHKLKNASQATRVAQTEAALVKQKEEQASFEAAFYANVSINKSHEAAEELSNINISKADGFLTSEKVKMLMDQAQTASYLASLRASEKAEQHILYEASMRDSLLKAKQEAVWADAMKLDLQKLINATAKGVQDTADEMNDTLSVFADYNISIADTFGDDVADKYLKDPR